MKTIKKTWSKIKEYWSVAKRFIKWGLVVYVVVSVGYTSLTITGNKHVIPFIDAPKVTAMSNKPAAEMSYKEWRAERAEWLKTTDSFDDYISKEALNVVDMKVQSEATAAMNTAAYGTSTAPANPL